jgi:hypothetical protein
MKSRFVRSQTPVCQLCDFISTRHTIPPRSILRASGVTEARRPFTTTPRTRIQQPRTAAAPNSFSSKSRGPASVPHHVGPAATAAEAAAAKQLQKDIAEVVELRDKLTQGAAIPSETEILAAFKCCNTVADHLIDPPDQTSNNNDRSASSALLSVDEQFPTKAAPKVHKISPAAQAAVDQLSAIAFSIIAHPPVFISPEVLTAYVVLQARLRRPESFPEAFYLYGNKPTPEEGSSPIKYNTPNPNKAANAIPVLVADCALQSAIETKQLAVSMNIVESAFATKAFRRAKFVRKGLLPATGLAVAPMAAYAVASQLSLYQSTMDSAMATNIAFAGILAYLGFTTTIGVVAVTTANDQMDRITWATGMPLRQRWIREEERAAIDKIAGAWGFRQSWRRGEEEGTDWDALREWVGRKGMILDRVSLLEGME